MFKILMGLLAYTSIALSAVTPPNYDFSLDSMEIFKPKSSRQAIEKKYGKGVNIGAGQWLYYVEQLRYRFPVLVQYYNDQVLEYFARLPGYFLHDIFHQSLINRIGNQDSYYKKEEQAVYIWKDKDGLKYVYSGACSITCFPVYLTVIDLNPPVNFNPTIETMANLPKKNKPKE